MGGKTDTIIFIIALAGGLLAVSRVDGGLVTSILVGAGVAVAVTVVGMLVVRVATGRRHP